MYPCRGAYGRRWGAMRTNQPQRSSLDPTRRSLESQEFEASLRQKIVGQEEGIRAVVDLYQVFCAQMCATGRPVGNLSVPGTYWLGQDPHRRGGRRNSVRRSARGDQSRLRRISALARDRQADRFASGLSGPPRDASADHPGRARQTSHRKLEAELSALRRDRKGLRTHCGNCCWACSTRPP